MDLDPTPPVPAAVREVPEPKSQTRGLGTAVETVLAARGQSEALSRLFARSPVPMVLVDNELRYIDVNRPARLVFRLSLAELQKLRINDLTPPRLWLTMEDAYGRLITTGCVAGDYEVAAPDGSRFEIVYLATANVLPGLHLIAFAPSAWSESELYDESHRSPVVPVPMLTPRELEVLELASDGLGGPSIARELVVSRATVRSHFENIYKKLRAHDRASAVARAMRLGLIP